MGIVTKADFQIDENALDQEWIKQPSLFSKYAKTAADARMEMDEAKNSLEVIKAEVSVSIRREPETHGLAKVTEASLKELVECCDQVRVANTILIEQRHHYEIMQAAVGAMDHRKKALEGLVSLFLADYYSQPRAKSSGAKEVMDEKEKQAIRRKR